MPAGAYGRAQIYFFFFFFTYLEYLKDSHVSAKAETEDRGPAPYHPWASRMVRAPAAIYRGIFLKREKLE